MLRVCSASFSPSAAFFLSLFLFSFFLCSLFFFLLLIYVGLLRPPAQHKELGLELSLFASLMFVFFVLFCVDLFLLFFFWVLI